MDTALDASPMTESDGKDEDAEKEIVKKVVKEKPTVGKFIKDYINIILAIVFVVAGVGLSIWSLIDFM